MASTRKASSPWWPAGEGHWTRYHGPYFLSIRKRGVGWYDVTVTALTSPFDSSGGDAYAATAGTLAGAKSKATQWVSDR